MAFKSTADFVHEYPCPCGKGVYRIEEWIDDWGGSREVWTMVCTACRKEYVVFEYGYTEKGRNWIGHNWITRDQDRALDRVRCQIRAIGTKTLQHAETKYVERWMALCHSTPNKKGLWMLLNDPEDPWSPSLSTFYKHARQVGLERYWRQQFSIRHMRRIINILRLDDTEIWASLDQIDEMQNKQEALEKSYQRSGFQ